MEHRHSHANERRDFAPAEKESESAHESRARSGAFPARAAAALRAGAFSAVKERDARELSRLIGNSGMLALAHGTAVYTAAPLDTDGVGTEPLAACGGEVCTCGPLDTGAAGTEPFPASGF